MPLIATRFIGASRVARCCEFCKRTIEVGEPAVRLFGNAFQGEMTGSVFFHKLCYKLHGQGYIAGELDEDNPYHA